MALLLILVALLFGVGFGSGSVTSHATGSGRAVPYRAHATLPARHDPCIGSYTKGTKRRPQPMMPHACAPQLAPGRSP